MITTDSSDYHVLVNAVKETSQLDGLICEIGTRAGGSLKLIIDTVLGQPTMRPIISIDPYGSLDFPEGDKIVQHDYTNNMRNNCMRDVYGYLSTLTEPPNVVFFTMEDTEFFSRFDVGVPLYGKGGKKIHTHYSMVFLDGPHSSGAVLEEFSFFKNKMQPEGVIVCDDIGMYPHDVVEECFFSEGFVLVEKTERKASYQFRPN